MSAPDAGAGRWPWPSLRVYVAAGCEKAVCYDLCRNAAGYCGASNWNKIAVSGSDQIHRNSYDMIIQKYLVV